MQAKWDVPNSQAYVGEQQHSGDKREYNPHGINHHKTGNRNASDNSQALNSSGDQVDLFDGVGAVQIGFLLEPSLHLTADVAGALEEDVGQD